MSSPDRPFGIDLDNTLICYDRAFRDAAVRRGWVDSAAPATKTEIKKIVLERFGNLAWTELQGFVYGPGLDAAEPFPGAVEFLRECAQRNIRTVVVSHKTRQAAAGPPHDLRQAALRWLERNGLTASAGPSFLQDVIFTETRSAKVEAVRQLRCQVLIDDLPEVFLEPGYPPETEFFLFDAARAHLEWKRTTRVSSWAELAARLLP